MNTNIKVKLLIRKAHHVLLFCASKQVLVARERSLMIPICFASLMIVLAFGAARLYATYLDH